MNELSGSSFRRQDWTRREGKVTLRKEVEVVLSLCRRGQGSIPAGAGNTRPPSP